MKARLRGSKSVDIDGRLGALGEAVALARGRLDAAVVERAAAVGDRAGARLGHGTELTVVALAGATGSGKSSLFNALTGAPLAAAGVRRPTTARPQACVWGEGAADDLLDWLGIAERHRLAGGDSRLDGMVLLDLPDHDSTEIAHRIEVDRLVELVDLLVWVVDPQKYADAALHNRYLRPLRVHSAVMLVALNRIDELGAPDRAECLIDLKRVLAEGGLAQVPVRAISCRTGEGLEELAGALRERVAARRAAVDRLAADVTVVAEALGIFCDGGRARKGDSGLDAVVDSLAEAAGVGLVADSVERSHRRDSALRVGWPFTRWLKRARPDPLRRLHLTSDREARTSLPPPTPVQRARLETSLRGLAEDRAGSLPDPWPELARRRAAESLPELPRTLDRVVATTETKTRPPRWWVLGGTLQYLLALTVIAGVLWLTALFGVAWLRLPDPPTPEWEGFSYPTLMLIGGGLMGIVVAFFARIAARVGGRRRAARVRRRLRVRLTEVAESDIVAPLSAELDAYKGFCDAVGRATGPPGG
ncbi:MAG TPA: YfjP family GTPase [Actinomycetota bacterium]|nr:YfjP family GTPase [Actinomycetota bacterium]